jgi:hypothetical protein
VRRLVVAFSLDYVFYDTLNWELMCGKFVTEITNFIKRCPKVCVHIFGPIHRGDDKGLASLVTPIDRELIIKLTDIFSEDVKCTYHAHIMLYADELQEDKVHLNRDGFRKLEQVLTACLREGFTWHVEDHFQATSRKDTAKEQNLEDNTSKSESHKKRMVDLHSGNHTMTMTSTGTQTSESTIDLQAVIEQLHQDNKSLRQQLA